MLLNRSDDRPRLEGWMLVALTVAAAVTFAWPFLAPELSIAAEFAPGIAIAVACVIATVALVTLNRSLGSAKVVALLAALTALGMVIRFLGLGFGGVEPVFALFIIAGRALGARFGFALGALVMLASSLLWGSVGPWLPFQMFAAAWVGALAGWLPRTKSRWTETALLVGYGIVTAYLFGLLLNLWWWPFAAGLNTSISYLPEAAFTENLARFITYSLVTSTLTWDTVRAITTTVALLAFATPALAALRRVRGTTRARGARSSATERREPDGLPDVTEPRRAAESALS